MAYFKKDIVSTLLVAAVLVLLGVFGLYVRVGRTMDRVVVLKTSGMTCSACAERVAATLEAQKGVCAVEVNREAGWVVAGYDAKQAVPAQLAERVTSSGYPATVQSVVTPAQFRQLVGHDICRPGGGCCGRKEDCCTRERERSSR